MEALGGGGLFFVSEGPLRGLLFYKDLGFSHTIHVLKEKRRRCEHPPFREKGSPIPAGPPIFTCWVLL